MFTSGKKIALSATKKIYTNSCVVGKKNSERNKKTIPPPPPPPFQVKWSVPKLTYISNKFWNSVYFGYFVLLWIVFVVYNTCASAN